MRVRAGVAEQVPTGNLVTDIPGLRSRISNPLDFLGLYGTLHEACHRHHIPALRITGDTNEKQILAAGQVIHLPPSYQWEILLDNH